jgi:hypothetical protein
VVVVVDADEAAMAIRALGAAVGSSVFFVTSVGALSNETSSVCAAVSVSASGVADSSAGAVDDFSLPSVSVAAAGSGAASVVEPVGAVVVSA